MSEGEEELNVGAVRLEEVASAANVSLSTASKALRGKPHVSEKTRIRVIDAAQRLGYSAAEAMASMARLSVRDSHGVQDFRVGIIGVDMKRRLFPDHSYWSGECVSSALSRSAAVQCVRQ